MTLNSLTTPGFMTTDYEFMSPGSAPAGASAQAADDEFESTTGPSGLVGTLRYGGNKARVLERRLV